MEPFQFKPRGIGLRGSSPTSYIFFLTTYLLVGNISPIFFVWRHSQVVKAAVCNTVTHWFESGCRLQNRVTNRYEIANRYKKTDS